MRIVAKARFNAHERLEAKAWATNLGLQMANLYTIAIGLFLAQFQLSTPVIQLGGSLNYVSLLASVFVQIMALVESLKDYSGRAKAMHDCALAVNDLNQSLESEPLRLETVASYNRKYQDVMRTCGLNHNDIDYRNWKLEEVRAKPSKTIAELWSLAAWRARYVLNVYGLTLVILTTPVAVAWILLSYNIASNS